MYNNKRSIIPVAPDTFDGIRLNSAGLLALADLRSIAKWTAVTGSSSFLDVLFIAPGIHQQQAAGELNRGEYPPTGAMTTGYVFRVENEATVRYLQTVGKTGHLTNLFVEPLQPMGPEAGRSSSTRTPGTPSLVLYLLGVIATVAALVVIVLLEDWWTLGILGLLIFARLCNVLIIRRRSRIGWKGASEPGVRGDLLVLLSQDRWIRIQGLVDDLKAVTAGQWLRDKTAVEDFVVAFSTMAVYIAAALSENSSTAGSLVLLFLLLFSAGVLELSTALAKGLRMHGRILRTTETPRGYRRRLDLVEELIQETGRDDWAIGLGMISRSFEQGGTRAVL
ncbi:hypothetical protein BDV12DRAFT_184443 [Aspergillus spectabilis]